MGLKLVKANPEGLPTDIIVDNDYNSFCVHSQYPYYVFFYANKTVTLNPGTYYMVLSKNPEFHKGHSADLIPIYDNKILPDVNIAVWDNNKDDNAEPEWHKKKGVMSFGVSGFWLET